MGSMEQVIQDFFPQEVLIPRSFYRNIDLSEEFGVSRFLTDRMAYLSRLLEKMSLEYVEDCMWVLVSETRDSQKQLNTV